MKTKVKIAKRLLSILLVFLFSINSIAAVSDNDGSAFITKAEFDALKSSFQAQIDTYNQNIDSKIDQAIASYLSGIKISKENALNGCTSNLEYPLDFYMVDPDLEYLSDWNTNGATPYWAPNWKIYFHGQRHQGQFLCEKELTQNKQITWFYNGDWDSSQGRYRIDGINKNVSGRITFIAKFYEYNERWKNEGYISFGFLADQYQNMDRQPWTTGSWQTRSYIKKSGRELVTYSQSAVSNHNLIVEAVWGWGSSTACQLGSSNTNNENYLNQFKGTAGGTFTEGHNPGSKYITPTLKFTSTGINRIYNVVDGDRSDATGKKWEVPVMYSNKIYLTNKNNFKKDLMNATTENAKYFNANDPTQTGYKSDYASVWRFGNFLTPGWTLEPQFSTLTNTAGVKHAKNQKSLMEPWDMYYEVTTPYTNTLKRQVLNEGVLLTENEKEAEWLKLEFNFSNITDNRYICFSTEPITEDNFANVGTTSSSNTFLDVADNEAMTGKAKKMQIANGDNTFYLPNISANSLIYYKILWGNNTYYTRLTDMPKITAKTKN